MKLAISNIAWNNELNDDVYKLMLQYGFSGLEIAPSKFFPQSTYTQSKETIKLLKQSLSNKNLTMPSMQSILYGRADLMMFESSETRQQLFDYLKLAIDFAEIMGIKNLVFGNPKSRVLKSDSDRDLGIAFFKMLGEYALSKNLTIGLEPNPTIYETNYMTTTEEALSVIRSINSPAIRLNFDLGAVIANNENIEELFANFLPNEISHVHISEPYLATINRSNKELHQRLFKLLKAYKYDGYCSIEMKNAEDNNLERIDNTLDYISSVAKGV